MDMVPVTPDFVSTFSDNEDGIDISDTKFERWHHATCQAVLVCSWRTQKEISAIFGFLASLQRPRSILEFDELISIGDYFLIQLTECKHRGAFECAYAAFVDVCGSTWRSACEQTKKLPAKWLCKIIDGLVAMANGKSEGDGVSFCATRRSAGVPYLVQAVLATEPKKDDGGGSALLYQTLEKLLRILFEEENGDAEEKSTAKVRI